MDVWRADYGRTRRSRPGNCELRDGLQDLAPTPGRLRIGAGRGKHVQEGTLHATAEILRQTSLTAAHLRRRRLKILRYFNYFCKLATLFRSGPDHGVKLALPDHGGETGVGPTMAIIWRWLFCSMLF